MIDHKENLSRIENATNLYGCFGPFHVTGACNGDLVKRHLNLDDESCRRLQVTVKTPLSTSFNCAIGGIQALIKCTIEKQRLRVDESTKNILAQFRLKGLVKATKISVNPKSPKTFMGEMSRKAEALHLADRIAEMQEHKIHVPEEVRVVL